MARLRVLSWNIRTFGTHAPTLADLQRIATIIVESQADIVCIQELMIGTGVVGEVGAPISQASQAVVGALVEAAQGLDAGAGWQATCSGVDSGVSDSMRDAHAFLFKSSPARSKKQAHAEAPDEIAWLSGPVILRQQGKDAFPGRRPAMLAVKVKFGSAVTPVNVISYHALTPCNRFSKGEGSGYGINALATLLEIGGGMQKGTGRDWSYDASVASLPQVDTIVVGDFNYSMDAPWAAFTYANLLTNYTACVSDTSRVVSTTYAPSGTEAFRLISAYDNIFVLKAHKAFTPSLGFSTGGAIDFIKMDAEKLGSATGILDKTTATQAAWYVIHQDAYKKQHAVRGISDHIPVWAEFTVGGKVSAAVSHVRPTSGEGNNCLLHAVLGVLTGEGMYVDPAAAQHRVLVVQTLCGYGRAQSLPAAVRQAILSAMINEFDGYPLAQQWLQQLLVSAANPFDLMAFGSLLLEYIRRIYVGRMFYVHEAELLAFLADLTIVLHWVDRGTDFTRTLNAGRARTVDIFHEGLHFSRWAP